MSMKAVMLTALTCVSMVCCVQRQAGPRVPFSEIVNVRTAQLHRMPGTCLFAINRDVPTPDGDVMWGTLDEHHRLSFLNTAPAPSLAWIDTISVSPGDRYLAVISVGEGHPLLDVFELSGILRGRDAPQEARIEPIARIDPYPGSMEVVRWSGERLVLLSDVDLERLDKRSRRVFPSPDQPDVEATKFLWDIAGDVIRRH